MQSVRHVEVHMWMQCVHHVEVHIHAVCSPCGGTHVDAVNPLYSDTQWDLKTCQIRRLSDYRVSLTILYYGDCTS